MAEEVRLEIDQCIAQMALIVSDIMRRMSARDLRVMLDRLEKPRTMAANAATVEHYLKAIGLAYVAAIDEARNKQMEATS